jgi:hypothetical protein
MLYYASHNVHISGGRNMRIAVPLYFLTDGILGEHRQKLFDRPEGWIDYFGNAVNPLYIDKILKELNCYFMNGEEEGPTPQNSCATLIFYSLACRYFDENQNQQYSSDDHIVWKYKFKKISHPSQLPKKNEPFTVLTIADEAGKIEKNIIYGPTGDAIFCIDFDKHGTAQPGHIHALIPGNIDHTEGEGHSFPCESIPWVWLAVSFDEDRDEPTFKSAEMNQLPYGVMTIHPNKNHRNPEFKFMEPTIVRKEYIDFAEIIERVHEREEIRSKKMGEVNPPTMLSNWYGTVKSYAPYLAALGLFYVGHRVCEKFGIYEELGNTFMKKPT